MSEEHRWCRFSRVGWGVAIVLACYVLLMHSIFISERQSLWYDYDQRTRDALNAQIQQLNKEYQGLYLQTLSAANQMAKDAEILSRYQCAPHVPQPEEGESHETHGTSSWRDSTLFPGGLGGD